MSSKKLINTATLREKIEAGTEVTAVARGMESVEGYLLHLDVAGEDLVLSTYLSDNPRLFKRPEALLKEARSLGIKAVLFDGLQS